jgi:NADPH:quinone reductase-like Zn-dependent oxidoreductase
MSTMKAIVLKGRGTSSVLCLRVDYPRPQVQPGKILVKVKAFAINHADIMSREGSSNKGDIPAPEIIGIECIAVVIDVPPDMVRDTNVREDRTGPQGARYCPGDVVAAVMGGLGRFYNGTYAEYALLNPISISAPLPGIDPSRMQISSFASLAAVPATFLTAYGVLTTTLRIKQNETLLVHAGSSSVGMAIAALAKHWNGVKKVVGTTRNAAKVDCMRKAGFDVVLIQPDSDLPAQMQAQSLKTEAGETTGFNAQVDLIGADHIPVSLACAKSPGGSRVCLAGMVAGAYHTTGLFSPMAIPIGVYLCGYSSSYSDHLVPLVDLVTASLDGKFPINVDKVFNLEDAAQAHAYYKSSAKCGKVVCTVD